jgi:hypothetical protein
MGVGSTARKPIGQQIAFLRKRILGSGGNATYLIGTLPAGANILRISNLVRVVFSGGTPTMSLGTAASPAAFFAAATTVTDTAGRENIALLATGALGVDVDTDIVAVIAGTPTAGTLDVEVEYTVPDETP